MKKILLAFCFWIPLIAFGISKSDSAINIDKIPKGGILLDKGWKFHAGDNKIWALPAFNDGNWQIINPAKKIHDLPQVRAAQIGWLRLKLLAGMALRSKTIAFTIRQIGASEIYLNGRLIRQYGKVSNDPDEEQTYDPDGQPLTVQLSDAPEQVVSVRYSYTKQNLYIGNGQSFLSLSINTPAAASNDFDLNLGHFTHRSFIYGVFIILSILHLFIYLSYRKRKINLYLSLFAFFQSCTFLNGLLAPLWHKPDTQLLFFCVFYIAAPVTLILLLFIVYDLFDQEKKIWFRLLALMGVVVIPLEFIGDFGPTEIILAIWGTLIYLEVTRISIIAFKRKRQGALLFLCGQIIALVFYCSFNYLGFFLEQPFTVILIEVDIAFLTPAVVISILLAREFAQNNISLIKQLNEVKKLSEKSIAQELEKQHLLANQNELLEQQVTERTAELNHSLVHLKQTQTQLIQREKMASLGELTAGIAHEIQNPLNFVTNFSEVNIELIDEMQLEIDKGDYEEVKTIANDIKENQQKINQHGKRADFIVKGMLQHSRTSTGERQLTNINLLADEFLKLSYHGLRAKDKSFNAEIITDFADDLPKINVVQQDIGRALLNLFNNAFYAVNQKKKTASENYTPTVTITTFAPPSGGWGVIVKDNGNGIPDTIKDKIMQPFFTTKPTGEGTGLGLSLTYDMVVKGHGGSIQVNSVEGEGSEFIIQLPIN